jgi:predicted nucleic acid-binding protein
LSLVLLTDSPLELVAKLRSESAPIERIHRGLTVFIAMIALKERRGEFTDALIAALAADAGCSEILTFDRKAARLAGLRLL